jgi:hypothetical protein
MENARHSGRSDTERKAGGVAALDSFGPAGGRVGLSEILDKVCSLSGNEGGTPQRLRNFEGRIEARCEAVSNFRGLAQLGLESSGVYSSLDLRST